MTEYRASLIRCHYAETRRFTVQSTRSELRLASVTRFTIGKIRQIALVSAWGIDSIRSYVRTVGHLPAVSTYCRDVRIVSFDVFDTLLYRTVEPPDILKRRAANYAAQLLSRRGLPITSELFLFVRNESEARLRAEAVRSGFDPECRLSDMLRETLRTLCGPDVAAEETGNLVRYELEVERNHLRVAPGARRLLAHLKERGRRIVVATDTYLEQQHIETLLTDLGLKQFVDGIYVSSEHRMGKSSGRLFEALLGAEKVDPRSVLHIGDAYDRDVRGAIKAAIRPILLFDVGRIRRRRRLARIAKHVLGGREEVTNRVRVETTDTGEMTRPGAAERESISVGRDILGPAFCVFVLRVIEESYRFGVSDIYYLAREGYLFTKIHSILIRNIHRYSRLPPIRCHYLYVSRQSTTISSIRKLDEREQRLAAYRLRSATLGECVRAFGLDKEEIGDLPVDLQSDDSEALDKLFADTRFAGLVESKAATERWRLRRYLEQEGFFGRGEIKALVDIGWNATIQANLTRGFHEDADFPTLLGLYFGRRYEHSTDYSLSSRSIFAPGLFYDAACARAAEKAIGHCLEIFELAAGAPHGATIGYKEANGIVEPVLRPSCTGLSTEQKWLQAGIMDYVASFSRDYNDHEPSARQLRDAVIQRLAEFIRKPTLSQTQALRGLVHSIDWGSERVRPLIATNLTPLSVLTPMQLICSLNDSCWIEGSLRLSRIPGGLLVLMLTRYIVRFDFVVRRLARFGLTLFRRRN